VQANFGPWLEDRREAGRPVPGYVEDQFRAFIDCGDPASGFSTWACPDGHYYRHVPKRCKGRGWCPSCLRIRQRDLARHLIHSVIGKVPVRHVVFCFPPYLREVLGYDDKLLGAGYHAMVDAVFEYQRGRVVELLGVPPNLVYPAAATTNHRVSANLATNHHYHGIFVDGAYFQREADGPIEFCRLPRPNDADIARIALQAGLNFCEALKGLRFFEFESSPPDTIAGVIALPKARRQRVQFFGQAAWDGEGGVEARGRAYAFHMYVGNGIEPEDRHQLEYLVNYILAPPFNDNQLSFDAMRNIVLTLKRARHDGRSEWTFRIFEFLDRLADLVPRPNTNTVRYFGAFASNAKVRKAVIALHVEPVTAVDGGRTMVCPVCERAMRFISAYARRQRRGDAVPPDTPTTATPRGQDRIGPEHLGGGQGRLYS
jgi:hypothetical protein